MRNLLLLLCLWTFDLTEAHVGLTFPPARKYDLDFLDNLRTKPPCGMPKGKKKNTFLFRQFFFIYNYLDPMKLQFY